ncbi:hypothetical protein SELMODRAFT_418927 [Selaginella moellendorffii]|uniref:Uncharacterized protein n=1 Tax=Selaginella moellendorffii TaxID=88036 RepID=D8S791_SELML|nr:hypothetical protein SELMODRAFT_418927 [Selaginella moellendorffii]
MDEASASVGISPVGNVGLDPAYLCLVLSQDLIHEIFKSVWEKASQDVAKADESNAGATSKRTKSTTANANALKLSCELLKLFVTARGEDGARGKNSSSGMRRLARGLATDCASNQLNLREYLDSKLCSSDVFTLARLIRECGSLGNLLDAQKIHSHVVESGFQENFYLRERLVHMYLKCGSVENAEDVFLDRNRMAHFRDVTTWTAMLSAYSRQSSSSTKETLLREKLFMGT